MKERGRIGGESVRGRGKEKENSGEETEREMSKEIKRKM